MKPYEEYLEEFKKEIEKGYEERTMVTALAEYVHKDLEKLLTTLPKLDGPPKASTLTEGGRIITMNWTSRTIKPQNAGFHVDLKNWADDPNRYHMRVLMGQLGRMFSR